MWIKICGITTADAVSAAAAAQVDAIGFVFAPSPRQVTPGQAAQLAALAPAGNSAHRGGAAPAADEGRRDLPHAQARLLSDRRRGLEGTEDSGAHQGAAGGAIRPQDAEPAAAAHRVRGADQRHRRARRLGPGGGARAPDRGDPRRRPVGAERCRGDPSRAAVRRRCELAASRPSAASRIRPRFTNSCARRVPRPRELESDA